MIRLKWRRRWKEAEEEAADLVVVASLGFKRDSDPFASSGGRSGSGGGGFGDDMDNIGGYGGSSKAASDGYGEPRGPKGLAAKAGPKKGMVLGSKRANRFMDALRRKANPWRRNTQREQAARKSRKSRKNPSASSSREVKRSLVKDVV